MLTLTNVSNKNPSNPILSYININSLRNKFTSLTNLVSKNIHILTVAETKLDSSFQDSEFCIDGFKKPYRLDVNGRSGGLLVLVKESISSKKLKYPLPLDIQVIPFEIIIKKKKVVTSSCI